MAKQFLLDEKQPWRARFFTIWGGQAVSLLGSQLVQFSLIWHLTVQTGSAKVLASAALAGMLPAVILGPFIGTLVDRWNRKAVMILADGITALAAVFLAVLFTRGAVEIPHIYGVIFIRSLAGCFHGNAMNASTSLMVPVERLTRVQGVNQMLNGGLNMAAAPLGALLLAVLPFQGILAIDVATALTAILPLFFLRIPQPECSRNQTPGHPGLPRALEDLLEGFRFVRSRPGLLLIGLMTVGINFTVIPAFSLLPLMVKTWFGGTAFQLGWVNSAMGMGILGGGALLGLWGGFKNKMLTSMIGLMGMGSGIIFLAMVPSWGVYLAAAAVFIVGLMNSLTMGPFLAVIQSSVEPGMQARVFSLLSSIGTAMVPLGLMTAGPGAERFGIQAWFLAGGLLCLFMGICGLFLPAVMNIEKSRQNNTIKSVV